MKLYKVEAFDNQSPLTSLPPTPSTSSMTQILSRSIDFLTQSPLTPAFRQIPQEEVDQFLEKPLSGLLGRPVIQYENDMYLGMTTEQDELLGEGRSKIVALAINLLTQQPCALGLFKPEESRRKQLQHIENMNHELSIMQALQGSEYIVKLENFFTVHHQSFMMMEYCPNNLGDFLHNPSNQPLSPSIQQSLIKGLTNGVAFIHSQGVLHRDLKATNILLTESLQVKIGDFGYSCFEHDEKLRRRMCGTTRSFSPQECPLYRERTKRTTEPNGRENNSLLATSWAEVSGKEADCWALGTIWFEILTYRQLDYYANLGQGLRVTQEGLDEALSIQPPQYIKGLQGLLTIDQKRRMTVQQAQMTLTPKTEVYTPST